MTTDFAPLSLFTSQQGLSMHVRTVAQVAAETRKQPYHEFRELPAPPYTYKRPTAYTANLGLCVPSMREHTTDEGWQLFAGLSWGGHYKLVGHKVDRFVPASVYNQTDVNKVLDIGHDIGSIVLQDKREWVGRTAGPGFDPAESFQNVHLLHDRPDIFKLTVLKDAHSGPDYGLHVGAAEEIGCHAWVTYYHPELVKAQAPFVRKQHLVRTYHSVDADRVPPFLPFNSRQDGILSGALSRAYPLRLRLAQACRAGEMSNVRLLSHPGYGRDGCHTFDYMTLLNNYKVSICTSSVFAYAVRKIIESTACGCRVITDLPIDDVLPEIDGNLYRVPSDISAKDVNDMVHALATTYDEDRQRIFAMRAKARYDYRELGRRLATDIEELRKEYNQ